MMEQGLPRVDTSTAPPNENRESYTAIELGELAMGTGAEAHWASLEIKYLKIEPEYTELLRQAEQLRTNPRIQEPRAQKMLAEYLNNAAGLKTWMDDIRREQNQL